MSVIITSILVITFMQGIYNCIPESKHVSSVYSVAAVLYLQFVLHVMLFGPVKYVLYFYISLLLLLFPNLLLCFIIIIN